MHQPSSASAQIPSMMDKFNQFTLPSQTDMRVIPKDQWSKAEVSVLEEEELITKSDFPLQDTVQSGQYQNDHITRFYRDKVAKLNKEIQDKNRSLENERLRYNRLEEEKKRIIDRHNRTLCVRTGNTVRAINKNYDRITRTVSPIGALSYPNINENTSKGLALGIGIVAVLAIIGRVE